MTPTSRRTQSGLTLVEACITLAVAAIVVGSAAPAMQGLIDARRLEGAATQLATDIQFIRSEAVARNEALRLGLPTAAGGGSCYVIHTGSADGCSCAVAGPSNGAHCTGDAQPIKTVHVANAGQVRLQANVASVLFDPLHGTSSPTGTLRLVGNSGRAVHHVINVMGRVRSCSPNAAVPGYRAC